ncbi:MAG TPA: serine/threonine-protein kinase [Actinomycetes bacterium]|nr:serine/threonine-protein kinase [Actinomycetes bacterium]
MCQAKQYGGDPEAGDRLGPYRLDARLGEGAMGVVFRGVHEPDGAIVALKVLRRELAADDVYRRRFAHEARAAAEVAHPHLARVLEAGEAEGLLYLAVGYVEGWSLADRLAAEGPLPLLDLLRLAAEVGAALDVLHARGLVHRDVKPSNVLLDRAGSAVLGDLGLAKGRAYTVLTRPGQVLGTLDYLAPELIRGVPAGPPSDIYALGCVVFECMAGVPPFAGKSVLEVGVAHLQQEPPDAAAGRADLSPMLSWAVRQALAKDSSRRPTTATAFARMLRVAADQP